MASKTLCGQILSSSLISPLTYLRSSPEHSAAIPQAPCLSGYNQALSQLGVCALALLLLKWSSTSYLQLFLLYPNLLRYCHMKRPKVELLPFSAFFACTVHITLCISLYIYLLLLTVSTTPSTFHCFLFILLCFTVLFLTLRIVWPMAGIW